MLKLVIIDDEGRKTPVPLMRSEITVGRAEGNTIRLTERNVSRRHASVYRNDNGLRIADTSRYGIKKNGRLIDADAAFDVGDVLIVGDYRVTLIDEEEQPTPSAAIPRAIPLRDPPGALDEVSPEVTEADTEVSTLARLVCLTEPFVGSEFVFMGEELVLGTGDSCDLIIQHESIADRHAKFTRDGDTYKVEALAVNIVVLHNDSAPGNPLSGRDLVRIGDLVFRYLDPGEAPAIVVPAVVSSAPLDDEDYRSSAGWWVTIIAALFLGGLVYFLWPSGGQESPVESPAVVEVSDGAAAFAAGQAAMREGDWDAAAVAFESVPRAAIEGARAAAHRELVESERGYAVHYHAAVLALEEQRYRDALSALNEIPPVSYYASLSLSQQLERRAVDGVVNEKLAESRAAQDAGDVEQALAVAMQIRPLAPQHRGLTNRIEQLRALQRGESWPPSEAALADGGAAVVADPGEGVAATGAALAVNIVDAGAQEVVQQPTRPARRERNEPATPTPRTQEERAAVARAEAARITIERREQERVERERAENAQAAAATSRVEDMRRESERRAAEGRAESEAAVTPEPAEEPLESRGDRAERLRQEAARAGIAQDYRGAIELLEEAAALNARDARIQLSLFSNYRRIGNRSRATRAVTRYLELRPDAPEREEFQTWLEMNAP